MRAHYTPGRSYIELQRWVAVLSASPRRGASLDAGVCARDNVALICALDIVSRNDAASFSLRTTLDRLRKKKYGLVQTPATQQNARARARARRL